MRLLIKISPNSAKVPFDHIPMLVGSLHKWLGKNDYHSQIALHSFSWLKGGRQSRGSLDFPQGAEWFINSYDTGFIKKIVSGIQTDPSINFGLSAREITIIEDPVFRNEHFFTVASPVLIKRRIEDKIKHYLFSDPESNNFLTETLITKLKKAGLESSGVHVKFDTDYKLSQTKLVNYNGIGNKASICPVTIKGTPEQIAFAWNVGIGNSTGIGFGALN